ncbi:MAG: NADH-ubiquinone oxidoreductase-F iron-sulfur binding region domain-containing protein [Candidatus Cloacimonetes bacterium]|jgi:NADH-quinone oxidoreductase subunit F|nr:4Fe-4S binding protein [Candidatus Cloacimonadota bacterium]MDD2210062.1 NADH-ubiquinone oxidoreductase-F iron-sulfur binding region domain-containing protein [Candidatus Cloacimonadota bacterium]MDY0299002.1 NADH-ubiquinone oxidoreductase-F iron-sulfur binding region domain-containing protein [Candidatus Cloacimonadaceae bacterium]
MPKLEEIRDAYNEARALCDKRIIVCAGTGCIANGSLKVFEALKNAIALSGLEVTVSLKSHDPKEHKHHDVYMIGSGCQGFCQVGPLVTIEPAGIMYGHVKPEDAAEIVAKSIVNHEVIERLLYHDPVSGTAYKGTDDIPFYTKQQRTGLKDCGKLDPSNIAEYIAHGGYFSARDTYTKFDAEELCKLYQESGLRGRGGGGFLTGLKWDFARKEHNEKKYVICNGDEGDPGAFMDRSILEGNPHSVIEGMLIAAKAIGANEGYVYVRMEYPLACSRIREAIQKATEYGILGNTVFGTEASFHINVMEGAGAFVCGEETALLASIEGKRGMPTPKPPFPAQKGLFGKPTVINNVETLALVPIVLQQGPKKYREVGTANSPGTKTFALTGHVANTGLIEVPFGTTIREIVFEIGGGVLDKDGKINNDAFKAVQIGGPSGGCLTREHLDLPIDFDSLGSIGAMVGSGGMVVMNNSTCMVETARYFMTFTQHESCGKCVPCREGTRQMLEILEDITQGKADEESLKLLQETGEAVKLSSLCGLGKSAPNPVLSTLRYFRDEYEAHVKAKYCPTKTCKALSPISIDPTLCRGCTLCKRVCPVGAICGEVKKPHVIDPMVCIKCGACITTCKFKAIS